MTGHGEGQVRRDGVSAVVEVRTLNSRYFKLTVRAGESFLSLEPRMEGLVRGRVRRGTVQISLRLDREFTPDRYRLNTEVLAGYRQQLEELRHSLEDAAAIQIELLLMLPGVVNEQASEPGCTERDWPLIEETLSAALENLEQMRHDEGLAMQRDLEANCQVILEQLELIQGRFPQVAVGYRARLTERLNKILSEHDVQLEPADVLREVGAFAERSDISEELVRLRSHIEQFEAMMQLPESSGRKLDFLTQEMFREANTIGSKANDAIIAGHVVEVKAMIERMREMIQNIE